MADKSADSLKKACRWGAAVASLAVIISELLFIYLHRNFVICTTCLKKQEVHTGNAVRIFKIARNPRAKRTTCTGAILAYLNNTHSMGHF